MRALVTFFFHLRISVSMCVCVVCIFHDCIQNLFFVVIVVLQQLLCTYFIQAMV